jgi:PAS domain S-box-containing protein
MYAKFPIKYKLTSIIFIILIPLMGYSVYHYFDIIAHDKEHLQSNNLVISKNIARDLQEVITSSFSIASSLSNHPAVIARDSKESDRLFAKLLPLFPNQLNILTADMAGNNYGSGVASAGVHRLNYNDKEWFIKARKGMSVVGDLHISKLFKGPSVMIAMPIKNAQGRQIGVMGLPLNLPRISENLLSTWNLPEKSNITVIDSLGNVLIDAYHEENIGANIRNNAIVKQAFSIPEGSEELECPDGIRRLHSFSSVPGSGWKVIVGVPTQKAYSHAYAIGGRYIVILLSVSLIALGLSVILSMRITRNLSSLVHGLGEIERGNLSFTLTLTGHDELMDVAGSFNRMVLKRKQMESAVQRSEEFLSSVLEGIGEGVVVIDRDYRIISANKGYCSQVKLTCDDIIGKHCYEISHHINEPCHEKENGCDCAVKKCFETGEPYRVVHTHYDRTKTPIYVETNAYPLRDAAGQVVAAIETLMDITEQRNLEAQLMQSQKMESVGLLAGGIAHDFNNILTAIIGYSNLLRMKMEKDSQPAAYVEQILASSERAANLTRSILAFSRKQIIDPRPIRLSEVITRLQKLLMRIIGENIELRTFMPPRETAIMADAGQIEQVLMNLCTNAKDAMPDGGILMMETELVEFNEEYVKRHAFAKPGKYMALSVTDTGHGLDENTKERIFEPFFTTKETGKGTGLGLSIVYGIIKQHNGYINVYSELGKGTTFRIYLPTIEKDAAALAVPALPPVIGGTETVLLAEDDTAVRELSKNILEEYGYTVVLAEDGEDAADKFKANPGSIDLLVLDVMMPKKSGKAVYDEARERKPGIKALFMSGYTANMIHKKGILEAGIEFITKPFSPNAFLRKVREVLDKKA